MLRLLRSDLYKLFHMISFWVITGISVAITFLDAILASMELVNTRTAMEYLGNGTITILLMIGVAIFAAGEFKNGYIKNIASEVTYKWMLPVSKMIVYAIMSLWFIAVNIVFLFAFGTMVNGKNYWSTGFNSTGVMLAYIFTQFLLLFALASLGGMVAHFMRGITVSVVLAVVVSAGMIAQLADMLIHSFFTVSEEFTVIKYSLPGRMAMLAANCYNVSNVTELAVGLPILLALGYLVVTNAISIFVSLKKDI